MSGNIGNHKNGRRGGRPYSWLGAGAVTVGIGAALAGGTAIAHADSDSGGRTAPSAHAADRTANSGNASRPNRSSRAATTHRGPRKAAAAADSTAIPRRTAARVAIRPQASATQPDPQPEPIDTDEPIGPIRTAGVAVATAVQRVDAAIYGTLDATSNWLSKLPATPVTGLIDGTLLMLRRNFFNQVPTVNPAQLTGQSAGPITGAFGAVDPEGEAIVYRLVAAPEEGTVQFRDDGTYLYTPGAGFDGSDAFVIAADDGAHGLINDNILQPRRPAGSEALVTVQQGSPSVVTFKFTYATYGRGFPTAQAIWDRNPEALPALQWAAFQLADAVNPQYTVTVNYLLGLASGRALANASSPSLNDKDSGFYTTVVQNRITKGTNPTSTTIDGNIRFNFTPSYTNERNITKRASWAYFTESDSDQYNFLSTATHEVLHSFGFSDGVNKPGCNEFVCKDGEPTSDPKTNWTYYDQFLGNADKQFAIDKETKRWKPAFDANVTGGKANGLYFLGDNAVRAFGGPVPLFSPEEYDGGSSIAHLADYFFDQTDPADKYYVKLMNAAGEIGEQNLPLSAVEIGILKDLGYRMKV